MGGGCAGTAAARLAKVGGRPDLKRKAPGYGPKSPLPTPLRPEPVKEFCGPRIVTPTTLVCPGRTRPACEAAIASDESSVYMSVPPTKPFLDPRGGPVTRK